MANVPVGLVSHTRRVCSLYKRALRNIESYYDRRHHMRYVSVLMRERFDKNKDIKDFRVAKQLLLEGEEELFRTQHWQPKKFANSVGGIAYGREVEPPDWVVDYWHPIEKAQYPKYFARRELRKKQYLEWYDKQYPDAKKEVHSH